MDDDDDQSHHQQSTYYDLLNVHPLASAADLRRAYQKAALTLHPDKIGLTQVKDQTEVSQS